MRNLIFGLPFFAMAFGLACNATDTGNPTDDREALGQSETTGDADSCDRTEIEIADLDAATSVGLSGQELLDLVVGEHRETMAWQGNSSTYGPESGLSGIVLTVEALSPVHLVEREPAEREPGEDSTLQDIQIEIEVPNDTCADLLEVDVRLHILTDGSALDETVDVTLQAASPDYASLGVELPIDTLTGSFQASISVPENFELSKVPKLVINAGISPYGSVGEFSLFAEIESSNGSAIGITQGGIGILAQFPAENFCGLGSVNVQADQELRGLSMTKVLQRLNEQSPVSLDDMEPEVTLNLDFASTATSVCVRVAAPASANATLQFPGTVELFASDGRAEGSIVVKVSAETSNSELVRVSTQGGIYLQNSAAEAQARRSEFAIAEELDFSAYQGGGYEFTAEVTDSLARGTLKAFGLTQPQCESPEPNPDTGEMSTPSCSGTQATNLWNISWEGNAL